jgi:hypothetical protein
VASTQGHAPICLPFMKFSQHSHCLSCLGVCFSSFPSHFQFLTFLVCDASLYSFISRTKSHGRFALRVSAFTNSDIPEYSPSIISLLRAKHLASENKVLCKYDLHGRCTSKNCNDVHIGAIIAVDDCRSLLDELAHLYVSLPRAQYISEPMFGKALKSQILIAQQELTAGTNAERCFASFVRAMSPLCTLI